MFVEISSLQNPIVKQTALLLQKKYRKEQNAFLLEGTKNTIEALNSGFTIKKLFIDAKIMKSEDFDLISNLAVKKNIPVYLVNPAIIEKLSDTKSPQPVISVPESFNSQLTDISTGNNPLLLVLDSVGDPGNLGTIIRTADAVGAQAVILNQNCADLFSPKTLRSTMGSIFHLPVLWGLSDEQILAWLKKNNIRLVTSRADAKTSMYQADFAPATALVMGNEAHGVSERYEQAASFHVSIPMRGQAESLNVAVASALLLYAARPF